MKDILFVVAGVAVFSTLIFGVLVFSMHGAHARVRFVKNMNKKIYQDQNYIL